MAGSEQLINQPFIGRNELQIAVDQREGIDETEAVEFRSAFGGMTSSVTTARAATPHSCRLQASRRQLGRV